MRDRVFISYRHSDSQAAVDHLVPRLIEHFGRDQIYRDIDSNQPGFDFTMQIDEALDRSAVVLVVIGRQWVAATDKAGRRRLDDPDDFTRREVEQALADHECVIPVLVDSAEMPLGGELPDSLRPLVRRHAVPLRSTDWNHDLERLIEHLERNGVRPALMAEYPRKRVKAIREEKIYEREYSSSRSRAREALSTTLSALHYPVITDDPERWEVRFLWGSEEKAAGRTVAALYRRIEPDGVRAVVLRTRPGHVKIMIESASVQRVIASISNVVPLLGVPSRSITMLERKVIREFLNQIQLVLGGHGVSKDPAAMFDNLMSRTTRGRSRS